MQKTKNEQSRHSETERILVKNRRAYFNYEVLDKLIVGIVLCGSEVKSIRDRHCNFADSYAHIANAELWLVGLHISPYTKGGSHFNHEPTHRRKLLAHKKEIQRLQRRVDEKGLSLVPLALFVQGSLIKLELGICRGKKLHDKRESIKERDLERQTERERH